MPRAVRNAHERPFESSRESRLAPRVGVGAARLRPGFRLEADENPPFERLVCSAMEALDAPAGLMVSCGDEGLTLRASRGVDATSYPEALALLTFSALGGGTRVIADLQADPLLDGAGGERLPFRFFAASVIYDANDAPLGVLAVLDVGPRDLKAVGGMAELQSLGALASYEEELFRLRERLKALEAGDRGRMLGELQRANERYRRAARATRDGLWEWDVETNTVYYSPAWQAIVGEPPEELSSDIHHWLSQVHPQDRARVEGEIAAHRQGVSQILQSEHRLRHREGGWRWVLARGLLDRDNESGAPRMAGTLVDVTARKNADPVTGVPNRLAFLDHLERRIEVARQTQDWKFAVFFLDMDRFKLTNDRLGHAGGDAILAEASRRLTQDMERFPAARLVARNGSDEFLILAEGIDSEAEAWKLAAVLEASLSSPVSIWGHRVDLSASIGFALAGPGCVHPEDLIADAETANSQAKAEGDGRCVAFTVGLRERAETRRQLQEDLKHAIESGQMVLHYQPEIDLHSGRIIGFEALVRWQHPRLGLVPPDKFIPIAEETGLILPLGEWGMAEACRQILEWRATSENWDDLRISVNLSAKQFAAAGLVQRVEEVLQQTGLSPCDLRLEVTESSLMSNAGVAVSTMKELRALGVGLHMDDFGTGYSSLQYLQQFPFDMLKIDRSFISRICENKESSEIVRTILDLARSLVMEVVAEGIETEEQMKLLKRLGCRFGQGFYFSKPRDAASISALLGSTPREAKPSGSLKSPARRIVGHA